MQMSASALKIRSAPALPRCLLKAWAKADSNRPLSRQDAGERPARNPMSDQSLPAQGADMRHENVSDRYKTVTSSIRPEEHTTELQSLMRIQYAVLCLKTIKHNRNYNKS